ncbi:hypothetical protein [Nocardia fluminea]|uniref:hypothetical protein n=1 Tax=Nocardia fluminea TaxID=134984 RepID=UPI003D0D4695
MSATTRITATRSDRIRNPVYTSGTAHQAKLGASTTSTDQVSTNSANHTGRPDCRSSLSAYSTAITTDRTTINGVERVSLCRISQRIKEAASRT